MKTPSRFSFPRLTAAALALGLFSGCGDDKDGKGIGDGAVYAAITQVSTADETQSYVVLLNKVDQTEALSLENATEIPGRALGAGIAKSGHLYVAGSEGAIVTRYKLTDDGKLVQDGEVSFSGRGVSSIGEYQHQFQFASATKAYYVDGRTAQVIVWNPTTMEVTNAVQLPGLTIAGSVSTFASLPVRAANKILIPVGWRPSSSVGITAKAGVIVVNPENDAITLVTDDRCGYVRDGVVGPDGQVYLATEAYGAAVFRTAGASAAPEPCLLRFDAQAQTFDKDFRRSLGALTNGKPTGSLLPGPSGTAYLRVLDETHSSLREGMHPRAMASAPAWKFWQLNLATLAATEVSTLPASTGSTFLYDADNRVLFTEFTNNSSTTNVRELTDKSGKLVFTTQGLVFSFLQLR
ncbi:hypothetical protein NVS55_21480 [Myxococcus stipitatus]|uniref:hypothetical protein n=1 Tax=Myxococcus stipitatus TaxID=83455 RepID=UPI0031451D2B